MSDLRALVQQQSRGVSTDGIWANVHMNRSGLLEINSIQGLYDSALRAGKVFVAGPDSFGATSTVEQNASLDLTEPFWRATVPASKVVIPISVQLSLDSVWTTADQVVAWISDTDTYDSGGDICIVRPLFTDHAGNNEPVASALQNVRDGDAALTEKTITNGRIFHSQHFVTGGLHLPYEFNALKGDSYPVIHGPASFGIAVKLGAAGDEAAYQVVWIELDKNEIVNS